MCARMHSPHAEAVTHTRVQDQSVCACLCLYVCSPWGPHFEPACECLQVHFLFVRNSWQLQGNAGTRGAGAVMFVELAGNVTMSGNVYQSTVGPGSPMPMQGSGAVSMNNCNGTFELSNEYFVVRACTQQCT